MACNLRTLCLFRGEYSDTGRGRSWRGEQLYLNQESQAPWEGRFWIPYFWDSRLVGTFRIDAGALIKEQWLRRNGVGRKRSHGKKSEGSKESACPVMKENGRKHRGLGRPDKAPNWHLSHPWAIILAGLLSPLAPPTFVHTLKRGGVMGNNGHQPCLGKQLQLWDSFISGRDSLIHIILLEQVVNNLPSIFRFPGNHTKVAGKKFLSLW